jgi:hypothetical protein
MTERPILFSAPMVRTILDGTKTQTRRIVKPQPDPNIDPSAVRPGLYFMKPCRYGVVGDRLWVRERMEVVATARTRSMSRVDKIRVVYDADGTTSNQINYPARLAWKPIVGKCLPYGGHREASRITLTVESVRVERLQDITREDARAEGIPQTYGEALALGLAMESEPSHEWDNRTTVENYTRLWDHINGERAPWSSNPWVWRIEYSRVKP